MGSRPAKWTQADVARVLKAAKSAGMSARIHLETGIIEVTEEIVNVLAPEPAPEANKPERILIG